MNFDFYFTERRILRATSSFFYFILVVSQKLWKLSISTQYKIVENRKTNNTAFLVKGKTQVYKFISDHKTPNKNS